MRKKYLDEETNFGGICGLWRRRKKRGREDEAGTATSAEKIELSRIVWNHVAGIQLAALTRGVWMYGAAPLLLFFALYAYCARACTQRRLTRH